MVTPYFSDGIKARMPLFLLLLSSTLEVLGRGTKQEKLIKGIQTEKKYIVSIQSWYDVYTKISMHSTKQLLELMSLLSLKDTKSTRKN